MAKKLTKKDETYLKRYARGRTRAELAQRLGSDVSTVDETLARLDLVSADSPGTLGYADDPWVKVYEKGLAALGKEKWAAAVKQFEQVLEKSDQPPLAARARQYLRLAQQRADDHSKDETDPFLEAVFERNAGRLDEALELCRRGGRQGKNEKFAYLAASIYALKEDAENTAKSLGVAIELNPKNRVHAHFDRDFDALREHTEIAEILAG